MLFGLSKPITRFFETKSVFNYLAKIPKTLSILKFSIVNSSYPMSKTDSCNRRNIHLHMPKIHEDWWELYMFCHEIFTRLKCSESFHQQWFMYRSNRKKNSNHVGEYIQYYNCIDALHVSPVLGVDMSDIVQFC